AFSDSNLLSGWLSYVRTDYRDSLSNESHKFPSTMLIIGAMLVPQPLGSYEQSTFSLAQAQSLLGI
ncbi:MAG: hypothetical protein V7K31_20890, partial [Nostoc sp.]